MILLTKPFQIYSKGLLFLFISISLLMMSVICSYFGKEKQTKPIFHTISIWVSVQQTLQTGQNLLILDFW